MDIEKDIIQDQKETIHRLQEECKEKTDIIMALEQKAFIKNPVEAYEKLLKENEKMKQALEEIREIAELARSLPCGNDCTFPKCYDSITGKGKYCMFHRLEEIKERINEVLGNE